MKNPYDLPIPVLYEQLAEEAVELAHSSLKIARILRGVNPTPDSFESVEDKVIEEFTDVFNAAMVLGISPDSKVGGEKMKRWSERMSDSFFKKEES